MFAQQTCWTHYHVNTNVPKQASGNAAHTRSFMLRKIVLRNTSSPIHDQVNQHHTRSIMLHNTQCCARWLIVYGTLKDNRHQIKVSEGVVTTANPAIVVKFLNMTYRTASLKLNFKQEVLGRTSRLLSLIRNGSLWKRRVQQFFCCCMCISYLGNVSTKPFPSNDRGNFIQPLSSKDKGVYTHADSNVIS
jgi:hypothetical protein